VARDQNKVALVKNKKKKLGLFFSTDGLISVRMVYSFYFVEEENTQKQGALKPILVVQCSCNNESYCSEFC
jgi:hypothetical protein